MAGSDWEYLDLVATSLAGSHDRARVHAHYPQDAIHLSGGDHPPEGQYVIDPDYLEFLGFEDPSELYKYHK